MGLLNIICPTVELDMHSDYIKALDLIRFYNKLGWENILVEDLNFFIQNPFEDIESRTIDLAHVFSWGPVKVGSCLVPLELYNYRISTNIYYIEVISLQHIEYG